MDCLNLSVKELNRLFLKGELSPVELLKATMERIHLVERDVNAFITTCLESAEKAAEESEKRYMKKAPLSPLDGIPVGVKDNIVTKGIRTTCGSRILESYIPPYNATVVEKLLGAGAVIVGKTNMDEFAMGSSTENSAFGPTKNPFSEEHVPGGSSGGSAAAVALREVICSLGSDTGGSIRQPAAFCGVVGMKPTYGRVSRFGLVAFASSLDQIGPITSTVEDCAILLNHIAGYDPMDSTSADIPVPDYTTVLGRPIEGIRIGVPQEYTQEGVDHRILELFEEAKQALRDMGAKIVQISLPHTRYSVAAYYIIATAEASSNLARYDGVKYGSRREGSDLLSTYELTRSTGFGKEVKRRIMLGSYVLSSGYYEAYYMKAMKVRTLIKMDFDSAFQDVDAILAPISPVPTFKIGERVKDPLSMYLIDIFTTPANLCGIPGISVPFGKIEGLPMGVQLLGRPFEEDTLLQVAYALQKGVKG
ncbi:MAG: Asp-tRNA(Asn)/Glu-tRNA(Gln) amidotransferase subunit GatA [Desulfatiglandales bacterium]